MKNFSNFPKVEEMSRGFNYILKHGLPHKEGNKQWHNGDRLVTVGKVLGGMRVDTAAEEHGCCVTSVKNWLATADQNNPRLDG